MTDAQIKSPPAKAAGRLAILAALFLGFAALILLAGWYAYHLAREFNGLRDECLMALIVAGIGATSCLAGVIHLLNLPLAPRANEHGDAGPPPWHMRLMLDACKRILLALQLLTSALAVAAAGILIFGFKIPGVA